MKVIVVGGVATGMSSAARLRRQSENTEIIVFERGDYVSFANCGLPYHIGGVIKNREELILLTPEFIKEQFNIEVKVRSEVMAINRNEKSVTIKNHNDGSQYNETYDTLILAPGAEPIRPNIPGIKGEGIFGLRNIMDMDQINNFISQKKPKQALVVGGGFIGIEMAENLHHLGLKTSIVERLPQLMNVVDFEIAAQIHQHLHQKGVTLYLNETVTEFKRESNHTSVQLQSGKTIEADLIILALGVRPETSLAVQAGLEIGKRGGISVNEFMQTSDKNIYAGGDAVEVPHPLLKDKTLIPLAGPANKQGRIIADNIAFGNKKKYSFTIGTAIAKIFDLAVAVTGLNENQLKAEKIDYKVAMVTSNSHAGYYPNGQYFNLKLLFNPKSGEIFGASAVGAEGIDRRIDVIAFALSNKLPVQALTEFEHCYAPPFSSAKDPVNMVGFVAENISIGKMNPIYWHEMNQLDRQTVCLLDVRTPEEFNDGHIQGAINISVDELRRRLSELSKTSDIVIYCAVGIRGYIASNILKQNGFTAVRNLIGGYENYTVVTASYL